MRGECRRLASRAACPDCASARWRRRCRSSLWLVRARPVGRPAIAASKIETQAAPDRSEEGPRARADHDDLGLHAADRRAAGRHHDAAGAPGADRGRPRRQARGARAHPGRAARASGSGSPACAPGSPRRAPCSADRLVELYKADKPDVVTVILESDGFADLLERAEFMQRVSEQDRRIIDRVRDAKAESVADGEAARRARGSASARSPRSLASAPTEVAADQGRPRRAASNEYAGGARRQAARRSSPTACGPPRARGRPRVAREASRRRSPRGSAGAQRRSAVAGPVRQGSGRFIWPVNGPITSPFGMRWGRLHAGIDIAVPERHADPRRRRPARVAIAGWTGGYGNYTCINHGGGALHVLRPPVADRGLGRPERQPGPGHRLLRQHRQLAGPHVHFEVRINGNPVDPMGYL